MSESNGAAELKIDYLPCGRNGSAILTARMGDDVLAHSKVDLSKPSARTEFLDSLLKDRPGINGAEVEKQLLHIGAELSTRSAAAEDVRPGQPDAQELLMRMPEHVRTEARAMLESPDLMQRVIDDVASLGVAGERELVATIYLVGISRLLPRPLAAIVQAPSSVGKSYVVEKTATMFPPETVIHAKSLTPQALFYMERGALRHRFIVAGERSRREDDEAAEATRALREMIASGRLTKLVPMKENGKIVTQTIDQPGPIAYIETTTQTRIFDEDANRCLLLTANECPEQTRRIVTGIAAAYAGMNATSVEVIIQRHYAMQRMLQQHPVDIPFAPRIGVRFPVDRVEARRAIGHLLGMVAACALLHQYQRKTDADGRLIAEADDYQLAYRLCRGPLARLLGGRISDAAIRFYDRLAGWAAEEFTTTEAVKKDSTSDSAIRGWLSELAKVGAVEQVEPGKGSRPAEWKLTSMDRAELLAGDCGLPETIE